MVAKSRCVIIFDGPFLFWVYTLKIARTSIHFRSKSRLYNLFSFFPHFFVNKTGLWIAFALERHKGIIVNLTIRALYHYCLFAPNSLHLNSWKQSFSIFFFGTVPLRWHWQSTHIRLIRLFLFVIFPFMRREVCYRHLRCPSVLPVLKYLHYNNNVLWCNSQIYL